jgi:RecB family exonuclease
LGDALAAELESALGDVVAHLGGERLNVTKHDLTRIHTCERHFLGTNDGFEWTPRRARGSVVHKAIQLAVNWRGEPHPAELFEESLARLVDGDNSMADWLVRLTEGVRADLRSEAVDLVSAFLECFPPVEARWAPVTETPVRVELFDGLIRLTGRVDLTLGRPRGHEPRKVIIDMKTGSPAGHHRHDLRFYALLETIRMGVPPRLLATCYLDAGRVETEEVAPPLLEAALARTIDGTRKLAEVLRAQRAATVTPGPVCGWCPLRADCSEGVTYWTTRLEGP